MIILLQKHFLNNDYNSLFWIALQNNHLVPDEFAKLSTYRAEVKFVNNDHKVPDPKIIFSHDAVWHEADPLYDNRMQKCKCVRTCVFQ